MAKQNEQKIVHLQNNNFDINIIADYQDNYSGDRITLLERLNTSSPTPFVVAMDLNKITGDWRKAEYFKDPKAAYVHWNNVLTIHAEERCSDVSLND